MKTCKNGGNIRSDFLALRSALRESGVKWSDSRSIRGLCIKTDTIQENVCCRLYSSYSFPVEILFHLGNFMIIYDFPRIEFSSSGNHPFSVKFPRFSSWKSGRERCTCVYCTVYT